jgi:DNA-binding NtrC family response regulator/tetratricopeptide (TPR) repeat protein
MLRSEILLLRGYSDRAASLSVDLLPRLTENENLKAQALFVLGVCAWELGDERKALDRLEKAEAQARNCGNWSLVSRVRLQILERSSDSGSPYHASLPLCAATIRAVHRSGDRQVLADAHITFARLEARAGGAPQAARHLNHANRLLREQHNKWLAADATLTHAIVLCLQGDLESACEVAEQAGLEAAEAGWMKGEALAAGNLAFFHVSAGRFEAAEQCLRRVERIGYASPSYAYALRDTKIALAVATQNYSESDRLWADGQERLRGVASWYKLRACHTRVRALIRQARVADALSLAESGKREATQLRNEFFKYVFQLSIAEIQTAQGSTTYAPLELLSPADSSLGLIGARRRVLAKALVGADQARARRQEEAAARILLASGTEIEWNDGTQIVDVNPELSLPVSFAVDDAVALIELAGYPHVLGREAYALLELSGVTEAQALVARGDRAIRCVATRGWTEAQAVAAATEPGDRLRIACGMHRDEAWEILAELRPTISDRCTGIAIRKLVDTAVTIDRYRRDEKQRAALWPADTLETDGGLWVSEQMTELLSIAKRIAPSDITVLLTGETGTGKEVLARAIHRASGRAGKLFVPFNCTAVPRDMLESQLFGYRKGAFTGAENAFDGIIRAAAGGTLFLDEIAEIGPDLQPKLLRFLETHEVHGLGEAQPVKVDVRVIAATNADLESLVGDGRFREDLFYRLNGVRLRLPPLRERREEIPPLIDHYLRKFAEEQKKGRLTLDDETLEFLVLYGWPGNVRQLVNEINRVVAFADPDSTITPALLSPEIQASRRTVRVMPGDEPEIRIRLDQPLNDAVEAIERMMVMRALDRAHGNYENAAKLLGISRKGLFLKRRRWGMQRAS